MVEIINTHSQDEIAMGSTSGMGFAFCKQIGENTYEATMPYKCCKAVLDDIIALERNPTFTNMSYGIKVFNKDTPRFQEDTTYLGVMFLEGGRYHKYGQDNFLDNIESVLNVIHEFEERFNLNKTEVEFSNHSVLFKIDTRWTLTTQLMSLYTLVTRVANANKLSSMSEIDKMRDNYSKNALIVPYKQATWEDLSTSILSNNTSGGGDSHSRGILWLVSLLQSKTST